MVNMNEFAKTLNKELAKYAKVVDEDVQKLAKKVADEGKEKIKAASPVLTGDYKDGWRVKKQVKKYIVHNATNYQLTHLLEFGHAKVDGGRVEAQPHIAPVETKMMDDFEKGIEKAVKG
jgi:Bacteriophage HK97-gp10, putative tail-component